MAGGDVSTAGRFGRFGKLAGWLLVAAAVAGVVVLVQTLPYERPLQWLKDEAADLGPWAGLAFGTAFVLATLVFVPAWPLTVAAGALFGPVVGTLVMWLAATASAAVAFQISRWLGRHRLAGRVGLYPRLNRFYRVLGERGGWKLVAAVRLSHAMPFGLQSMLFGLTPIRFGPYLVTSSLVMLPGTFLYVYLGHLGAAALETAVEGQAAADRPWGVEAVGVAVAACALAYVAYVARRALNVPPESPTPADGVPGLPFRDTQAAPSSRSPSEEALSAPPGR